MYFTSQRGNGEQEGHASGHGMNPNRSNTVIHGALDGGGGGVPNVACLL